MSTIATITINVTNPRLDAVSTGAKIAAINFAAEMEDHGLAPPFTSDTLSYPAVGTIRRVLVANMSAIFMASYASDTDRVAALRGWIRSSLSQRIPVIADYVTEAIVLS